MRKAFATTLMIGTALTLAACGGSGAKSGAPKELEKGQVVATVDGQDITVHELNAELQGVALPSGDRRKAVEQAALQQIINRRILANIAREQGIDKTPMYILQERRADEALLVQLLQRDVASKIPQPTRADAEKFISDNPNLFAQRKIYEIDQIQFEQPEDISRLAAYEPLDTLDQIEQRLKEDGIKYRRAPAQLDTIGANPGLLAQINRLPAGEVFLIPTGRVVLANRIKEARVVPFGGDEATQYATRQLQGRELSESASKQFDEKIKKARDSVKYQTGYAPPAPPKDAPKAGASATPAAAATPAAK